MKKLLFCAMSLVSLLSCGCEKIYSQEAVIVEPQHFSAETDQNASDNVMIFKLEFPSGMMKKLIVFREAEGWVISMSLEGTSSFVCTMTFIPDKDHTINWEKESKKYLDYGIFQ